MTGPHHGGSQAAPVDETPHAPACLTMGPCAVVLDLARFHSVPSAAPRVDHVVATSDRQPLSVGTTPELPPPRA
jgi:hypothetical protein